MLIKLPTEKTVDEAVAALEAVVADHHLSLILIHNFKEALSPHGFLVKPECLIFEIRRMPQEKEAAGQNNNAPSPVHCRISIYEEHGKTILATVKPTALLMASPPPQLETVAKAVENTLVKLLSAAA